MKTVLYCMKSKRGGKRPFFFIKKPEFYLYEKADGY